jgi:hypothetical protein
VTGAQVIRPPRGQAVLAIAAGGRPVTVESTRDGAVRVALEAGAVYVVTFG